VFWKSKQIYIHYCSKVIPLASTNNVIVQPPQSTLQVN
jgi:hypothetical protein